MNVKILAVILLTILIFGKSATIQSIEPTPTGTQEITKNQLAFVSIPDSKHDHDGRSYTAIDVINSDGSDRKRLLEGEFIPLYWTISPSGRYILYVSPFNGERNIFAINIVERQINQITYDTNTSMESPGWSPDEKQIVFAAKPLQTGNITLRSGRSEIYTMNVDGTNRQQLTNDNATDFEPIWSPDGQHIAFISDGDNDDNIYIMKSDGTNRRQLTKDSAHKQLISWSPNSQSLLFVSYIDGTVSLHTLDVTTDQQINLSKNATMDFSPSWSPSGHQIVFTSTRDGKDKLYVMDSDGTNSKYLVDGNTPTWSPDGKYIAFSHTNDSKADLYVIKPDGTALTRLTYNGVKTYIWIK